MKLKLLPAIICGSLALSQNLYAKSFNTLDSLNSANQPSSIESKLAKQLPIAKAATLNVDALIKEDLERDKAGLPYRFAVPFSDASSLKQLGTWESKGDTAVWRLKLSAADAESLNIGFKNLFLPNGAKLFIYTNNYESIVGPYTHKDNKSHKQLWTPVIESSEVTVEINVPSKLKHLLKFDFAEVNQGYRGIDKASLAKSGSCNNDVVCPEGDPWRNEIRSVARYTISGAFLCTGSLVNNVKQNRRPYFLTANHCNITPGTSPTLVFYWNYETTTCQADPPDGSLNQFQTGSSYRASYAPSDVALVELDSVPDPAYNVHWAGWDNRNIVPISAVAIHHPAGDEKRISFDNDPLTVTNYLQDNTTASGTHLRVGDWEDGTTEGGSSGSGLWNANHHIVGTLHGGHASCTAPDAADWYGRFHLQWEGDGTPHGQLKAWLDPDDTSATTLDGVDACTAPTVSISNPPATANFGEVTNFTSSVSGGTGPYTLEWDFNNDGVADSVETNPSYSFNFFLQGNIRLTATDANGCSGVDSAAISIANPGNEVFPTNGQTPDGWDTPAGANGGWAVNNTDPFEGTFTLKAGTVSHNQTASIEVTENFTGSNNFVSFAVKVSSEARFDFLKFFIDDVEVDSWSGEQDWSTVYYPLTAGNHTLRWSYIKDGSESSGSDTAWIDGVTGVPITGGNGAPSAIVAQSTINTTEGDSVTLDASGSTDPENETLSFLWTQTSGPSVTINSASAAVATFDAPSVSAQTTLTFSVTVTDTANNTDTETVTVVVADDASNQAPVAAVAQTTISVDEAANVTLDASSSSDPNNDTLTYQWTQTSGTTVALSNANTATATFTAPEVSANAQLVFMVTVTDPSGASDTAQVTVTVRDTTVTPPTDDGGGGGGAFALLTLLVLLPLRRLRK